MMSGPSNSSRCLGRESIYKGCRRARGTQILASGKFVHLSVSTRPSSVRNPLP
jgi:hypothetical protein